MATENFDDAFANLIRDETGVPASQRKDVPNPPTPAPAAAVAAEAPAAPAAPEAPAAPPAPAAEAVTEGEPVSEIEGVEGTDAGGEPPPPPEQKNATDDALARLADMLAQRQPAPPPARPEPAAPTPPAFSPEETAFLTQYQTDFPDVARAEATIRRAEYQQLTGHIFREMASYFAPHIALLQQLADNTAYNQVIQRVPNYDAVRDQVAEWVKTQPDYLQVGMNHVIAQGTAEQIADLFDRFQQATGAGAPQSQGGIAPAEQAGRPSTPPPAAKTAAELSPAAKQAAARLAPVNGKRTVPTQAAPTSFDDAFKQYAEAG